MVHLIKSVQQAVLMNPLAFINMMYRTTIADQNGHGYQLPLCIVVEFNGPKTLITLKNTAASYLLSI